MRLVDLLIVMSWAWFILLLIASQAFALDMRPGTVISAFWISLSGTSFRVFFMDEEDI